MGEFHRMSRRVLTRHRLHVWCGALALLPAVGPMRQDPTRPAILGRWHGRSICEKGPASTACRDEEVMYRFTPSSQDHDQVRLHAEKVVHGAVVPMGDLELSFNEVANSWVAEINSSRLHALWQYRVDGSHLDGRLVDIPSNRLRRQVRAVRDSA